MRTFREAQSAYQDRLLRAFDIAREFIADKDVALTQIGAAARDEFVRDWQDHPDREVGWDWTANDDYQPPKGFNAAIWSGGRLCGLARGKLTAKAVRLDYIEGFPGDHPLKGDLIPIMLTCVEAYRAMVGLSEIRLQDVAEELIPLYERNGFELAPESGRVHVMRRTTT